MELNLRHWTFFPLLKIQKMKLVDYFFHIIELLMDDVKQDNQLVYHHGFDRYIFNERVKNELHFVKITRLYDATWSSWGSYGRK